MNDNRPGCGREANQAQRLVIKIGSSSLTREDGGFDFNRIDQVAQLLATQVEMGKEVVLVSSGAIAAGRSSLGLKSKPKDLPTAQACAAMGQGLLLAHWTQAFTVHRRQVAQVLLTLDDVTRRQSYVNAKAALEKLLSYGVVPVVNENDTVATDEIRFGDNDRLAALVAELINADLLILLTDVDGLYTAPPGTPGAKKLTEIADPAQLRSLQVGSSGSDLGTGGMMTKVAAASQAIASGIPVVLASANDLEEVLVGKAPGTFFTAQENRRLARPTWLAHAAQTVGEVHVDDGAAQALVHAGKSLLAAGVTAVHGNFNAGQVVRVIYQGEELARGIAGYDADQIARMAGKQSEQISVSASWASRHTREKIRPVIHKDDLVLTIS